MHYIQEEIGLPQIKIEKISDHHSIFTVSPLPQGYGTTLGNGLRRVLLSSLPGAAVTGLKINGISHEYSTVKGLKDSILDIALNFKMLHLRKTSKEPSFMTLTINKEGIIKAGDIKTPHDIEILNPDLYITSSESKSAKCTMEIRVEKGVGYVPVNQRNEEDSEYILVDAIFSPVQKVRYEVENTRVGDTTNLDKLTLEIITNGSITPEDSLKFSSTILKSYFELFDESKIPVEADFMSDFSKISQQKADADQKGKQESYTPIEILGLSPRTLNALINGGIGSIEQLTKCSEAKLSNLRGFGKKALNEVKATLKNKGYRLSDEDSDE